MNYKSVYRRTISDENWIIPFGKYKGLPLIEVMDKNPHYILYCTENDIFELSSELWTKFYILNPWAE